MKPLATENPYRMNRIPACTVCLGHRFVYRKDFSAKPCPNCGCTCAPPANTKEERVSCDGDRKFKALHADAYLAMQGIPTIRRADMTEAERELFDVLTVKTHELDALRAVEGLRYKPEEDREFMRDSFAAECVWREARDATRPEPKAIVLAPKAALVATADPAEDIPPGAEDVG